MSGLSMMRNIGDVHVELQQVAMSDHTYIVRTFIMSSYAGHRRHRQPERRHINTWVVRGLDEALALYNNDAVALMPPEEKSR